MSNNLINLQIDRYINRRAFCPADADESVKEQFLQTIGVEMDGQKVRVNATLTANHIMRYTNMILLSNNELAIYNGKFYEIKSANKIVEQLAAVGIDAYVATWSRGDVQTKLTSGDYSMALCAFNFDVNPDPGFTLSSTASCNYTRYRSDDMNSLLSQLRTSVTSIDYQNVMNLIQDQFEQDKPFLPLYWRTGALLSRAAFTDARDIRELELLRGVESFGTK